MLVSMMAAVANNNVIGGNNQLLWHLPADLSHFKKTTLNKPIIMGRKTFDSIGRPLPKRTNIVVTRQPGWQADGVETVTDFTTALQRAKDLSLIAGGEEVIVIGGAQIYRTALPLVQRIYLTRVYAEFSGDTYFPTLDEDAWKEVEREDFRADLSNPFDYSFITLKRLDCNPR